jgi:hypothetical protein
MVYDEGLMRSILALGLALLVLAAEVPGLFIESPVCAAVDGRASQVAEKSCCGTASCPMHANGCGAATKECTMGTASKASATTGPGAKLCAASCGGESVRVMPGVPDPGTLDPAAAPTTHVAAVPTLTFVPGNLPTRNPVPADPPPRA